MRRWPVCGGVCEQEEELVVGVWVGEVEVWFVNVGVGIPTWVDVLWI